MSAAKPVLHEVSKETHRPQIATLGQCLQDVTERQLMGVTRVGGFSLARWQGLEHGEKQDTISLHFEAATVAMNPQCAIEINIASNTPPATARELLKAVIRELKDLDSLEPWTPQEFLKSTPFDDGETIPF